MYLNNILWALESILLWHSPQVSALGESIGKQFGQWDEPFVHHSYVVRIELFVFQCFFLVWYLCVCGFILPCLASKALPFPRATFLCWETQTKPYLSMNMQRIAVNHCYFFALSQVQDCQGPQFHYFSHSPWTRPLPQQATPSCLAGGTANSPGQDLWEVVRLAWLYWSGSRFYDSWNGLTSTCLQKSSGHYHLFHGKHLAWCLPIILIHETYLLLSSTLLRVLQPSAHHAQDTPTQHSLSFFYAMHMALSDYVQHVEGNEVFTIDFPLTKGLRHIIEIPPIFFYFFEKDTSSDLWEVATCLSKLLWMMDDSIPIFLFAHHCWNCASLRLGAVGNGASKDI